MMTVDELYKDFVEQLKTIYDEREANNIADWVFESIAGGTRLDRISNKQQAISSSTIQQLNNALQQLLQHKPVQYVLGDAWFYKMKLKVNEHVLIPRPETEELVEWVVEEIRNKKSEISKKVAKLTPHNSQLTLLDIGTGSGCIAIAIKKELPDVEMSAVEISEDALSLAKENAAGQNVKINFLQLDFLDEGSWPSLGSFNILISNPPYIPGNEKIKLAKNVVDHEPHLALFVNDDNPLIFYQKIADFADKHLKEEGKIFVEVHEDHTSEVQQIFKENDFATEIKKDIYGRDRMIKSSR
ncbi:MAG TPA: peptide chain release factor N(5)-glutamine methyltransferase [Chitinophagaceae bacterium]|nr:peptide chain release factor N(5)-glutamine methyltransferase [Chitinophagaceae bacterium]